MQNAKILPLCGLILTGLAILGNHAFGRLKVANLPHLPVERFPRTLGGWTAGPDRPVDPAIQKGLPTAHIVERAYTDGAGHEVDVTLINATAAEDLHDPNWCLPAQGWTLGDRSRISIDGQPINAMSATQGSQRLHVLYWLPGADTPNMELGMALSKVNMLSRLLSGNQDVSLMVRLLTPGQGTRPAYLDQFVREMKQPLNELAHAGTS